MCPHRFKWISEPKEKDWSWVNPVFRELSHYYDDFIEDVAEIPFNYTERAFVGSLGIAASRCGYYTLSEYTSKDEEGDCRYPDFWLTLEPLRGTYDVIFEVKRDSRQITDNESAYNNAVSVMLNIAGKHLDKYDLGKRDEAQYQCALAALQIRCEKNEQDECDSKIARLVPWLKGKNLSEFSDGVDFRPEYGFWYLYWIPRQILDGEFKNHYWSKNEQRDRYRNPALALLVVGLLTEV